MSYHDIPALLQDGAYDMCMLADVKEYLQHMMSERANDDLLQDPRISRESQIGIAMHGSHKTQQENHQLMSTSSSVRAQIVRDLSKGTSDERLWIYKQYNFSDELKNEIEAIHKGSGSYTYFSEPTNSLFEVISNLCKYKFGEYELIKQEVPHLASHYAKCESLAHRVKKGEATWSRLRSTHPVFLTMAQLAILISPEDDVSQLSIKDFLQRIYLELNNISKNTHDIDPQSAQLIAANGEFLKDLSVPVDPKLASELGHDTGESLNIIKLEEIIDGVRREYVSAQQIVDLINKAIDPTTGKLKSEYLLEYTEWKKLALFAQTCSDNHLSYRDSLELYIRYYTEGASVTA